LDLTILTKFHSMNLPSIRSEFFMKSKDGYCRLSPYTYQLRVNFGAPFIVFFYEKRVENGTVPIIIPIFSDSIKY